MEPRDPPHGEGRGGVAAVTRHAARGGSLDYAHCVRSARDDMGAAGHVAAATPRHSPRTGSFDSAHSVRSAQDDTWSHNSIRSAQDDTCLFEPHVIPSEAPKARSRGIPHAPYGGRRSQQRSSLVEPHPSLQRGAVPGSLARDSERAARRRGELQLSERGAREGHRHRRDPCSTCASPRF